MNLVNLAAAVAPGEGVPTNTWAALADQIRSLTPLHDEPSWFRIQLYIFFVGFIVAGLLHLSALVIPLVRGKSARRKHMWLVHTKHVGAKRAYFVPNGRLVGSIAGLAYGIVGARELGTTLFSPANENDAAYSVYFIFLFIQAWITAFDALFADALCAIWRRGQSDRLSWGDRMRHPYVLNTVCWIVPVFAVATITTFSVLDCRQYSRLVDAKADLLAVVDAAAAAFDQGSPVDMAAITTATSRLEAQVVTTTHFSRTAGEVFCAVFGLALVVYVASLALLVRMVLESNRALKKATSGASASVLHASVATNPCVAGEPWSGPSAWRKGSAQQPAAATASRTPKKAEGKGVNRKRWHMLAAFLGINVSILVWLIAALIFACANLNALFSDFALYRRVIIIEFWPICILGVVMGVLGLMRVCDGLWAPAADGSQVQTPRRSAASESYVGLFADVRDEPSLAGDEEAAVKEPGVYPIELAGEGAKAG